MGRCVDEEHFILGSDGDGVVEVAGEDDPTGRAGPNPHRVEDSLPPQIDDGDGAVVVVRYEGESPVRGRGRRERAAARRVGLVEHQVLGVDDHQPVGLLY